MLVYEFMDPLLHCLLFSLGFNLILYVVAYFFQTDKLTDISYSLTFVILSSYSLSLSQLSILDIILFSLVLIWGLRLGSYLFYRIHQIGRDKRFDQIRENPISFLFFWVMQGLTCFIVLIPVILTHAQDDKNGVLLFYIGSALCIIGLIIESIADHQKFIFKKLHPDKYMSKGLWSFLQHPNYTGELLFWWGVFITSIPYTNWYISILGPLWISFIIIRFSGISILQKKWTTQYGAIPEFQKYQKATKKLIPFIY